MIVSLNGTLLEAGLVRAVVECAGVGYEVAIPVTTAEKLPRAGNTVRLHTHQTFREDGQSLFGFATAEERDFFRILTEKVSGIGPKTALNILSKLSLPVLQDAIARADVKLLSACPGIGKKTAERLVIELRDKVFPAGSGGAGRGANAAGDAAGGAGNGTGSANGAGNDTAGDAGAGAGTGGGSSRPQQDAVAALVSLGVKLPDADKAVRRALERLGPAATAEDLIRAAL